MAKIELKNIGKDFGAHKALVDVSFEVNAGEYVVILGPTGCGKTTLLKTIAGLIEPDTGSVFFDGADVSDVLCEERDIAFFFQHYALFPHLSVAENVGFALGLQGLDPVEIKKRVDEKLVLVGLINWAENRPNQLSGGMQQRVALARALVKGAKVLLLDEPLNALDEKIAQILRKELQKFRKDLGITVIHVTPNQREAMELADKIILLKDGRVVQVDSDVGSYTHPDTPFAAYFIGKSNFFKAQRVDEQNVSCVNTVFSTTKAVEHENVIIAIRCEKVIFEKHDANTLSGKVKMISFLGTTSRYEVSVDGKLIHVETSKGSAIKVGDTVDLYFPPDDIMVFHTDDIDEEIYLL